jgi:hypothetical protein
MNMGGIANRILAAEQERSCRVTAFLILCGLPIGGNLEPIADPSRVDPRLPVSLPGLAALRRSIKIGIPPRIS